MATRTTFTRSNMNGLDWVLLALLALGAIRGFRNGFIVEVCSLLGLVLGIWGAVHFSGRVSAWLGWGEERAVIAFLITVLAVMLIVHLIGRALTAALDLAQLSLPNRVAGIVFGALRMAFLVSVLLNGIPAAFRQVPASGQGVLAGSRMYGPVCAFAPMLLPVLGETKWVKQTVARLKAEGEQLLDRPSGEDDAHPHEQ
ncbi:MAG: CvpA family protein [Flavobacteriales bacterium]